MQKTRNAHDNKLPHRGKAWKPLQLRSVGNRGIQISLLNNRQRELHFRNKFWQHILLTDIERRHLLMPSTNNQPICPTTNQTSHFEWQNMHFADLAHICLTKTTSTINKSVICRSTSCDCHQPMVETMLSHFTKVNLIEKRYSEVCINLQFVLDHSAAYVPDFRRKSKCLSTHHT